jgi:hypothetical protein
MLATEMTRRLEEAFRAASALSAEEQDALAGLASCPARMRAASTSSSARTRSFGLLRCAATELSLRRCVSRVDRDGSS